MKTINVWAWGILLLVFAVWNLVHPNYWTTLAMVFFAGATIRGWFD